MNFQALSVVVVLKLLQVQAVDNIIYLSDNDFYEIVKSNNFFVVFINDRSVPEFNSFYEKVAQLYNSDKTSQIKFGKVMCKNNPKLCRDQKVNDEPITLKFFGKEGENYDYEPMANFFSSTIAGHVKNFLIEEATALKIRSGKNFVKFTVPYCGFCKKMATTWIDLEKDYDDDQEVSILSVDCKKQSKLCDEFEVRGYPSLVWIEFGKRIDKYTGHRNVPDYKNYIKKMRKRETQTQTLMNTALDQPAKHESAILDLTSSDFKDAISSGFCFVYFCLSACKHCEEISVIWNELAKKFISNDNIKIARVNCETDQAFCYNEVRGCPTLNIYSNGQIVLKDYYEDTTLEGLVDAITSHATGGKVLDDWTVRIREKRRLRRQKKKKESEAQAFTQP